MLLGDAVHEWLVVSLFSGLVIIIIIIKRLEIAVFRHSAVGRGRHGIKLRKFLTCSLHGGKTSDFTLQPYYSKLQILPLQVLQNAVWGTAGFFG